ncbi:MAG: choice-of-anchor J domain-containing protein, partial [Candidatus Cloacimonadaceae bacterium]
MSVSGELSWERNNRSHSGSYSAKAPWHFYGSENLLITPALNLTGADYRLKFWLYGSLEPGTDLKVQIATSNSSAEDFCTDLAYYIAGENMPELWTEQTISLAAYEGIQYIAFRMIDSAGYEIYIDDLRIEAIPAEPIFSYNTNWIDFGTLSQNQAASPQNLIITNEGSGTMHITADDINISGTDAASFSFDPANLPAALGNEESVIIPIGAMLTAAGPANATLSISYGGVNYNFSLDAEALPEGTILIGDGTAEKDLPVNAYYEYSYTQTIYPQAAINTANQRIKKLYYYWNGEEEGSYSGGWTIYMGHTHKSEFTSNLDWIPLSELTEVFRSNLDIPSEEGWIEVQLQVPFAYNNIDNLVIAVDENTPDYDGNFGKFYCSEVDDFVSLLYYSDNTNPDPANPPQADERYHYHPNIKLQFSDSSEDPEFAISPVSGDYGKLQLGESKAITFTIRNSGGRTLSIAQAEISITGTNATEFSLSPITEDISLEFGETAQITVNFSPRSEGLKSATLQIIDNTPSRGSLSRATQTLALSGEGFDAIISEFPYTQNFDDLPEGELPFGWTVIDANGDGITWKNGNNMNKSGNNELYLDYNRDLAADDYVFTAPLALKAGLEYRIEFYYGNHPQYPENLKLMVGQAPTVDGLTTTLLDLFEFQVSAYTLGTASYSPATTGNYYFAWHGYSAADQYYILLDDISIDIVYDYPVGIPITVGEEIITITGGSANNGSGEIPPVNNGAFVASQSFILELFGAGPWSVNIQTAAPYGAFYRNGEWTAVENVGGEIVFADITASKDLTLPIVLGDENPTLPVTLSSFTAVLTADLHVNIAWTAESETNHAGYNILRSEVQELSTAIMINSALIDEGIENGTQISYEYTDTEVYHQAR